MSIGAIAGIASGILTGCLVAYFNGRSIKQRLEAIEKEDGTFVMTYGGMWKLSSIIGYTSGILGVIAAILLAFIGELENAAIILVMGATFIFVGVFSYYYNKLNRIEYNQEEIRQYLMMKKTRTAKWEEINKVEFKDFGGFFILHGKDCKIILMPNMKGFLDCIRFAAQKVDESVSGVFSKFYK